MRSWSIIIAVLLSGCLCGGPQPAEQEYSTTSMAVTEPEPEPQPQPRVQSIKNEDCTKVSLQRDRDGCYVRMASVTGEITLCDKVVDRKSSIMCEAAVGGDSAPCKQMAGSNQDRLFCEAVARSDLTVCVNMMGRDRDICYSQVAFYRRRLGACDEAQDRLARVRCYGSLGQCLALESQEDRDLCERN